MRKVNDRPTPEEVALKQSMRDGSCHSPRRHAFFAKELPRKRTEKGHYYYIKNRIYSLNFKIRDITRKIALIKKKKPTSIAKLEELNIKLKMLEEKVASIVVPDYKRR